MTTSDLIKTVFLPVSAEVAWGYLTKADKLALWFHAPKTDLKSGEPYALFGAESGDKLCWGQVLTMKPYTTLVYSFTVKPFPDAETKVHWTLDQVKGGTRITMHHSGLGNAGEGSFGLGMAFDKGWDEHFAKMRAIEIS